MIFKKIINIFYNLKFILFGKLQYDGISRKILDLKINKKRFFHEEYEKILNNKIFNYSDTHPFINSYKSKILFNINPKNAANEIKNFEIIKKNWLKSNPRFYDNSDYLPFEKIAGAIGNYTELFNYLNYRFNVEKKTTNPKIIISDKRQITNLSLFKHFEKFIDVVESPKDFNEKRFVTEINKVAIDIASIFDGKYFPHPFAANFVNQKTKNLKNKYFKNFKLSDDDYKKGFKNLQKFGIKKNDWYVLFHIRDRDGDEYRNSKPETYIEAMKSVIKKGGWAIRVGRHERYKFPKIKNLIDYSFSNIASDSMDIFLAATCKFCVATSSGFAPIPKFFGKPVLLSNCLPTSAYLELDKNDLFLPKKLLKKNIKKIINFEDYFGFPTNYFHSPEVYEKNQISIENNTTNELKAATNEMFEICSGKLNPNFLSKNKLFKEKLKKDLKNDFEFDLSHECFFSESLINNYI